MKTPVKLALVVIVFSIVAVIAIVVVSAAAKSFLAVEVEDSSANLSKTDSSASGGKYVNFSSGDTGTNIGAPKSLLDWSYPKHREYTATSSTRYVSPSGSSSGDGKSKSSPISIDRAISIAQAGDVIYLAAGQYNQQVYFNELKGTAAKPIVFTTAAADARKAIISHGSSYIARLIRSSYVTIQGLVFDGRKTSVWGFATGRTWTADTGTGNNNNIELIGNEIKNVGKEYSLNISLTNGALVHGNYIHDGGGHGNGGHGEGMYLGCGNCSQSQNTSKNVTITANKVELVGAEAVDIKHGLSNVKVADNLFVETGWLQDFGNNQCCFGGAVVATYLQSPIDSNVTIDRNRIVKSAGFGLIVGTGNTSVSNNLVINPGYQSSKQPTSGAASAKEPYATMKQFFSANKNVGFTNNHSYGARTSELLYKEDTYGAPARDYPNFTSQEIYKASSDRGRVA